MAEKVQAVETGPIALALIIAALLFSGAFYFAPQKTMLSTSQSATHVLSVSADAQKEISPDKVEMTFSVVSRGADPAAIQVENDAKLSAIKASLLQLGIPAANIQTVGYSLDRWQEYNKSRETYDDKGYQLSNSLRVVSYDVSQAGTMLKSAVAGGANDVSGISFGLSDKLRDSTYSALLKTASSQAKAKAETMASAAGVSIVSLSSMNEGYSYYAAKSNVNYRTMDAAVGGAVPSAEISVSAGTVEVTAQVSATYEVSG
ncbi:MAG: SIMPL domain-containing protein [Candidatus Micrarchaeia archaeon]